MKRTFFLILLFFCALFVKADVLGPYTMDSNVPPTPTGYARVVLPIGGADASVAVSITVCDESGQQYVLRTTTPNAAALGGVDVILFTGGVGENQATCRAGVCEGLEFLGVKLDPEKNKVRGEEAIISTDDSRVKVVVIPTDEELLIASDTMAILDK